MSGAISDIVPKMSIFEDFECLGQWDVPELGNGLCGRLIHDKNGISLDVMRVPDSRDALDPLMFGRADGSVRTAPYIRGIAETGEHVVLGRCAESRRNFSAIAAGSNDGSTAASVTRDAPGIVVARYSALSMHASRVPLPDSPPFNHMSVTYTSLSRWLGPSRADAHPVDGTSPPVTVDRPEHRGARISDELSLWISRTESVGKSPLRSNACAIRRSDSIRFDSPSPRPPSWFYGHARTFRNFLMMAMMNPVHAETFRSTRDGYDIGVLPVYIGLVKPNYDNNIPNMYFDYQLIRETFDRTVTSWFGLAEKYSAAMDIYFMSRIGLHVPPKLDFLAGVQALEAFFRAKYPGNAAKLKEILDTLLGGSYEQFDTEQEKSDFVSSVVDTRNDISHGSLDKPRSLTSDTIAFYRAAAKVGLLIYGCILRELDADDGIKGDIFKRKRGYIDSIRFAESY